MLELAHRSLAGLGHYISSLEARRSSGGRDESVVGSGNGGTMDMDVEPKLNGVLEEGTKGSDLSDQRRVRTEDGDREPIIGDSTIDNSTAIVHPSSLPDEDCSTCLSVGSLTTSNASQVGVEGESNNSKHPTDSQKEEDHQESELISNRPRRRASSAAKAKASHQVHIGISVQGFFQKFLQGGGDLWTLI